MTLACNGHVREPAVIESVSITCPLHEWTDCWHVMAAVSSLRLGGEGGREGGVCVIIAELGCPSLRPMAKGGVVPSASNLTENVPGPARRYVWLQRGRRPAWDADAATPVP
jgi:hypothetical protein